MSAGEGAVAQCVTRRAIESEYLGNWIGKLDRVQITLFFGGGSEPEYWVPSHRFRSRSVTSHAPQGYLGLDSCNALL